MKRAVIITVAIFLLGMGFGVLFASRSSIFPTHKNPIEISQEATSTGVLAEAINEIIFVKRVIDGDTIELVDGRKVRYIGIDTPETVDPRKPVGCFGREAAAKNRELVSNKEVELEKDISETDRYGRLLRYVYVVVTQKEKVMVNEELVREGYAQSSIFPPDVKYQDIFRKAEVEAMAGKIGLWENCMLINPSPSSATSFASPIDENSTTPHPQTTSATKDTTVTTQTTNGDCTIKGNISSSGEKIYHMTGCGSYDKTAIDEAKGEHWFCTEDEAVGAGWRKAKNC